eukprot:CAMPEP_0195056894 /NCGR_PEP_ID=MMETSP0448-20130528/5136_1 /TAXON_ID=66468 /ORGANISM="Heterocapsa triquestra, Strain CCMP 448" /LENGTH=118 /DNA_ID=CAMNT_0040086777 /DNA_START=105 /DNA_END=459 /DNA_ORIENTATION=+
MRQVAKVCIDLARTPEAGGDAGASSETPASCAPLCEVPLSIACLGARKKKGRRTPGGGAVERSESAQQQPLAFFLDTFIDFFFPLFDETGAAVGAVVGAASTTGAGALVPVSISLIWS